MQEIVIICSLLELQKIDLQRLELEKERYKWKQQAEELEKELASKREYRKSLEEESEALKKERATREEELRRDSERLKKWEKRLNETKDAREASALAREIDSHKRLHSEMEEELLLLIEREEEKKKELSELEKELSELEKELERVKKERDRIFRESESKLSEYQKKREEFAKKIPRTTFRIYEQVRRAREGLAVVAVRDGSCSGCNMRLRPQLYNTIQKMKSIETCPGCHRILYWEEGLNDGCS